MASRAVPFRERFWFLPAVLCTTAVLLAQGLITLDRHLTLGDGGLGALLFEVGAAGSRDLLGTVAGSVLTAAATTFSITIAVLALTTSSYGPRLVRNFMADRGNQAVLGVFLATFLYALLVLRSVRDGSEVEGTSDVVPNLSVNVALLLAVLDIAVLVYFIHHISDSIQISTLSARVRDDLRVTIEHLYPEAGEDPREDTGEDAGEDAGADRPPGTAAEALPAGWRATAVPVPSATDGYVAGIDTERIIGLAERHDVTVVLECSPGDHFVAGDLLGWIRHATGAPDDASTDDAKVRDGVCAAITVGSARTPRQDVRFAVLQLVEIAVRALSPGTNDPFTAVNALDDLSASLSVMAGRRSPSAVRLGPAGDVRLIAPSVQLEEILREVFAFVRCYALAAPAVLHRALALAESVGRRSRTDRVREVLDTEITALVEAYSSTEPLPLDLGQLSEHAWRARRHLWHPLSPETRHPGPKASGSDRSS